MKTGICRNCNASIPANAKTCPSCGAKNKKPFYQKWWFILIAVIIVIRIIAAIGGKDDAKNTYTEKPIDKTAKYTWPDSTLGSLIPQPESKYGKINYDDESRFSIDIYDISQNQFEEYIEKCKSSGFTVDYSRADSSYSADNENGYSLRLGYDDEEKIMDIFMDTPDEPEEEANADDVKTDVDTASEKSTKKKKKKDTTELVDGMRPEFKEAMDSYEKFFNEYCKFMKKYSESDDTVSMLADYTEYMSEYADAMEKLDEIGEEELNSAELKYYTEVMGRINQKLLEAASS